MTLCLAINYGSRAEIVDAVRDDRATGSQRGKLAPEADRRGDHLRRALHGRHARPDLLIRTAGEMRVSNFLLWQISYAELWVTPRFWPDFDAALLHEALRDYARRERRFGGLNPPDDPA